ncbi:MAG: GTP-binding protein [Clostridia bacterium]|nr:GTP-binding protein [Clostridia bacterium]
MTKIDIFSGFLGAGKTTLIKKLIKEAYSGEKVVLIENEFGEIGIDGGFLKEAGIEITEMNSGCICCSLVGDFTQALAKVLKEFNPDRIIIEPSGVGKLSDVIGAVNGVEGAVINALTTVVDAKKCKMYIKNFGEFFINQVENATAIVLSHTAKLDEEKLHTCIHLIREHNESATIVTTDWEELTGEQILSAIQKENTLEHHIHELEEEDVCEECGHHHHHGEECHHEHHHEHDEECTCGCHHEHHHHDHEHHEHHHHHEHGEECSCGCHHDHHEGHHHHHHADEVFTSFGKETAKKFTAEEISNILLSLEDEAKYGVILRAKGIVAGKDGSWIHFDYIPGEPDVRSGAADITGRICVIGAEIKEDALAELFGV